MMMALVIYFGPEDGADVFALEAKESLTEVHTEILVGLFAIDNRRADV